MRNKDDANPFAHTGSGDGFLHFACDIEPVGLSACADAEIGECCHGIEFKTEAFDCQESENLFTKLVFLWYDYAMEDKEKELVKRYPEAPLLVELAKTTWSGDIKAARVNFSLSDKLKAELKKLLDKEIKSIFITDSDVRHIKKNHGQGESKRGQEDITPEDFALIPAVMNEFDTAYHEDTDRRGNKKVLFVKKVNGAVYTASVERGNNQLGVITLWKTKARSGA